MHACGPARPGKEIFTQQQREGHFFFHFLDGASTMMKSACAPAVVSSLCALAKSERHVFWCLCACECLCLCECNAHVAPHHPRLQEAALFLWRWFCLFGSKRGVRQRRREGLGLGVCWKTSDSRGWNHLSALKIKKKKNRKGGFFQVG